MEYNDLILSPKWRKVSRFISTPLPSGPIESERGNRFILTTISRVDAGSSS